MNMHNYHHRYLRPLRGAIIASTLMLGLAACGDDPAMPQQDQPNGMQNDPMDQQQSQPNGQQSRQWEPEETEQDTSSYPSDDGNTEDPAPYNP